jgi:type II secretory pathway component GspD/PulD (secretin)
MSISILGAIFAPVLIANGSVTYDGFGQEASSKDASRTSAQDSDSSSVKKDEVLDEFGTFEIAVEDVPLPQVLNMLAIQSRRNIITSKRVGNISVTANLFDVTFYEALDGILHIASLCYEEDGNFIYVMTCDEKVQRAEANRVLEDRVFYLDHISPGDAESLAKPLLSSKGMMSMLGEVEGGFQPGATEAGGDGWAHEPVLVVRDYAENLKAIQTLLTDVDTPPKQVMVESTILITKAKGDYAWGMDVSVLLKADFTQLLNPLNPVSWLQNLQQQPQAGTILGPGESGTPTNNALAIQSTVGQTTEAGGFKLGVLNDNVGIFLRLLDEVSDTTILARPKILALNRQRAQVLVGERVAYLSTTQTETAATQTVQFLETGINLILRPFISRDGSIRMELYPSVSNANLRSIGNADGIGTTVVPDELTNEITTNVRVRDGETVVLGGLFKDETTINRRSVPGLGDVPILGNAFNGQNDDVRRQEIIFLVTPTIIREEIMTQASEQADELVGNVMVGVREGLLPWARETLAINSNHDAYKAMDTGEVDLALSHINRSLRNNPNQPEMVQMREDLLGEESIQSHDGDILRGIFDRTFYNNPNASYPGDLPKSDPLSSNTGGGSTDAVETGSNRQQASSGMESETVGTWTDSTAANVPSGEQSEATAVAEPVVMKAEASSENDTNPAVETASSLESATTVSDTFGTTEDPAVETASGLESATTVSDTFGTTEDPAVETASGLESATTVSDTFGTTEDPAVETASTLESATTMADTFESSPDPAVETSKRLEETTTVATAEPSYDDAFEGDMPFEITPAVKDDNTYDSTLFDTQENSDASDEFAGDEAENSEVQSDYNPQVGSVNEFDGGTHDGLWNLPGTDDSSSVEFDNRFDTFADITPASTIKVDSSNEGQQEYFSSAIPFESVEYSEEGANSDGNSGTSPDSVVQKNFMFSTLFRTSLLEWWIAQARFGNSMSESFASADDE